jgi:hypothetical protein
VTEFQGSRSEAKAFLSILGTGSYVYILRRPDGSPFYVGKGGGGLGLASRNRIFAHEDEAMRGHVVGLSNPFKCNVIRQIIRQGREIIYEIESTFADEAAAYKREAELIAEYRPRHAGGCLTNLSSAIGNSFGLSDYSRQRHAATLSGRPLDNPERSVLNEYIAAIGPVDSVPVKPIAQLHPIRPSTPHPSPRAPTARLTYALIASAAAHGLSFDGALVVPRRFEYKGVAAIIENGVARDILKARLAEVLPSDDPRNEGFGLSVEQSRLLVQLYGSQGLFQLGVLSRP